MRGAEMDECGGTYVRVVLKWMSVGVRVVLKWMSVRVRVVLKSLNAGQFVVMKGIPHCFVCVCCYTYCAVLYTFPAPSQRNPASAFCKIGCRKKFDAVQRSAA